MSDTPTTAGVVFLVVMAQLAVCNAYVLRRNTQDYDPVERPGKALAEAPAAQSAT